MVQADQFYRIPMTQTLFKLKYKEGLEPSGSYAPVYLCLGTYNYRLIITAWFDG